jgi:hypothetical protein
MNMQFMKGLMSSVAVAAALVPFLAAPSNAATLDVVYQDSLVPTGNSGLQNWQGNLGMQFQVNSPLTVDALGAFDNGLTSELNGTTGNGIQVGIFNSKGVLVGSSVLFTTLSTVTQIAGDAFQFVTPFVLGLGNYSIVSLNDSNYNQGFAGGNTNSYQTLNSLGGAITFTGPSTYDSNNVTLELPLNIDGPPVDRYDAGTFAVVTPLPSTWTMLIAGFVGFGFFAYRGSKKGSTVLAAA